MKKAQTRSTWVLVILILAVVALVIAMYVLFGLAKAEYDVEDKLCRQSNQLRSVVEHPLVEGRPGIVAPKSPKLCITKYEGIDASDFSKCDPELKDEFDEGDKLEALRGCAAHQIAQLIYRCWWMSGEGNWGQAGSWKCFTSKIEMNQFAGENSQKEVREELKKQLTNKFNCNSAPEYYLSDDIRGRITKGTPIDCHNLTDQIAEKLVHKLVYNGLVEFYRDRILKGDETHIGIENCTIPQEPPISAEELVGGLTAASELNGKVYTTEACTGIITFAGEYLKSIEHYQDLIKAVNKEISRLIETNLKEEYKKDDITIKVCRSYKSECETESGTADYEEDCCSEDGWEEPSLLDYTFEATIDIGGALPDIGSIKESDILYALNNRKIVGEEEIYKVKFFNDVNTRFKLSNKFEINPNSLFEIGFCDRSIALGDPMSKIKCNLFDVQHIQLGPGGSVGIGRAGSPYCSIFNAFNDFEIVENAQKYCESRSKQM